MWLLLSHCTALFLLPWQLPRRTSRRFPGKTMNWAFRNVLPLPWTAVRKSFIHMPISQKRSSCSAAQKRIFCLRFILITATCTVLMLTLPFHWKTTTITQLVSNNPCFRVRPLSLVLKLDSSILNFPGQAWNRPKMILFSLSMMHITIF